MDKLISLFARCHRAPVSTRSMRNPHKQLNQLFSVLAMELRTRSTWMSLLFVLHFKTWNWRFVVGSDSPVQHDPALTASCVGFGVHL